MYAGQGVCIDPYLSDSLTEKYSGTSKPHVRITERVVDPGKLRGIVAATSSHNHTDHLDAATLLPLKRANPDLELVLPAANRQFARQRLGGDDSWLTGLLPGERAEIGAYWLTAVPAAHEEPSLEYMGLLLEVAGTTIYHAGDCVLFDGLVEWLRRQPVDIALLPINGSLPERQVAGNFWGREAAWLAREIGAKLAVPMHFDMFEFNTVTTDEFVEHCEKIGQPYRVLRNGERLDVVGD
jgi:L-ascorbate metabolism protein UlaG (beta-lactamase superfamily)